ncbi:hypothetical protein Tco_1278390 [Tanacetum coccineum]
MPAVQADFLRKKSGNAAVQAVYKKKLQTFPQRHVAGETPAKGQNSREVSPATCRWGIYCHRGTNSLTKKYVGPTFRWGTFCHRAYPINFSPATFRWGYVSPATCRWRKGENIAGESIKCCSE